MALATGRCEIKFRTVNESGAKARDFRLLYVGAEAPTHKDSDEGFGFRTLVGLLPCGEEESDEAGKKRGAFEPDRVLMQAIERNA